MTSNHQPADMGMTASAKVGYKMLLLQKLLSIFNFEGGYEGASHQHAQQKQGCKGIDYGGKPHLLDCMNMLKSTWHNNETYA